MPAQYVAIRNSLAAKGTPLKQAKKHAAMIYNSQHPDDPVGRHSDGPSLQKKKPDALKELAEKSIKKG